MEGQLTKNCIEVYGLIFAAVFGDNLFADDLGELANSCPERFTDTADSRMSSE